MEEKGLIKLAESLDLSRLEDECIILDDEKADDIYGGKFVCWGNWKSHATLTLLAKQDLPTFGYNMIDPLKSWCWGSILFYPFKISRFS